MDLYCSPFLTRVRVSEPLPQQIAAAHVFPASATADLASPALATALPSLPPHPGGHQLFEYSPVASLGQIPAWSIATVPAPKPRTAAPAVVHSDSATNKRQKRWSDFVRPSPKASSSSALQSGSCSATNRRQQRSPEFVRVSSMSMRDQIYFRDQVRRVRITFDSLRALLKDKVRRPDMRAAKLMGDQNLWLNRDRRIVGAIPGISVGDAFFFRMELCVLGLHGQVRAGIDYFAAGQSDSGEPIATSIIVSGGYEDDEDHGDTLVYTGSGCRDPELHKHCVVQKLEGGNLALERSMAYGIEIRVIRGVKYKSSPAQKVYFYDGLYKVIDYWCDRGKSGYGVYKYKMMRIEGQESMGSVNYHLAEQLKVNALSVRPTGYLSLDISRGLESSPVALYNDVDDQYYPLLFDYLARPVFPSSVVQGKFAYSGGGCECIENCSIIGGCHCAERNGGEFVYDKDGGLLRGKPLVYECGPYCRCPPSCPNRVSQKGLKTRLEVFRSRETEWGLRSLDLIKSGSFICEISGFVLTDHQTKKLLATTTSGGRSLVHPNSFPPRWSEWGDVSRVCRDYVSPCHPATGNLNFSIDVSKTRNAACYFSHSCCPNVFVQFVLFDHYNVSYPHLMVFALENIPPLTELSIDYGCAVQRLASGLDG